MEKEQPLVRFHRDNPKYCIDDDPEVIQSQYLIDKNEQQDMFAYQHWCKTQPEATKGLSFSLRYYIYILGLYAVIEAIEEIKCDDIPDEDGLKIVLDDMVKAKEV